MWHACTTRPTSRTSLYSGCVRATSFVMNEDRYVDAQQPEWAEEDGVLYGRSPWLQGMCFSSARVVDDLGDEDVVLVGGVRPEWLWTFEWAIPCVKEDRSVSLWRGLQSRWRANPTPSSRYALSFALLA